MDIIKNPVVFAMVGGLCTYLYMQYKLDEKNKIREKRGKKPEELNLLIPLAIAFIIWVISYMYLSNDIQNTQINKDVKFPIPLKVKPSYRIINDVDTKTSPVDIGFDGDNDLFNSLNNRSDIIDI